MRGLRIAIALSWFFAILALVGGALSVYFGWEPYRTWAQTPWVLGIIAFAMLLGPFFAIESPTRFDLISVGSSMLFVGVGGTRLYDGLVAGGTIFSSRLAVGLIAAAAVLNVVQYLVSAARGMSSARTTGGRDPERMTSEA